MSIYDVIYVGDERSEYNEISELAKAAGYRITEDYDFIHGYRLVLESDIDQATYYLWLLRNGLFEMSLDFQMVSMSNPERVTPLMKQVAAENQANGVQS